MCGMALVHSRVGRVFIREKRAESGGAFTEPYMLQCKKGLNHHYKVYEYVSKMDKELQNLQR